MRQIEKDWLLIVEAGGTLMFKGLTNNVVYKILLYISVTSCRPV
jgi:hypothetical protein